MKSDCAKYLLLAVVVGIAGCADTKVATNDAAKSEVEMPEAQPAAFNTAGAPTVQFSVPDMVCESCSEAVHSTLATQPGAKEVVVDLEKKVATVAVDEAAFNEEAAVAALLDKQFTKAKLME
jgi:copper chaperone CopZ